MQVYNPTHGQKVKRTRLNVMGRVLDKQIQYISTYLDKHLIRRVRVAQSGVFECRMDLSSLTEGKHEVEVRALIGHRTERLLVPILYIPEPRENAADEESSENSETQDGVGE
jgi:hypothetical protein